MTEKYAQSVFHLVKLNMRKCKSTIMLDMFIDWHVLNVHNVS